MGGMIRQAWPFRTFGRPEPDLIYSIQKPWNSPTEAGGDGLLIARRGRARGERRAQCRSLKNPRQAWVSVNKRDQQEPDGGTTMLLP